MRRARQTVPDGLLPKDARPIRLVPGRKRELWERLERPVRVSRSPNHGKRWSEEDIERIIRATPETDTYEALAKELGRSDGAIRHVKMWAGHILKGEYVDKWGTWTESQDRHLRANKHDVILVHMVLKERGYLDLPITEQFRLARPLNQPRSGWRGDRTGEAIRRRNRRLDEIRAGITRAQKGNASE